MNIAIFTGIIIGIIISMIFISGFNAFFSLMHNQALKGVISFILFILSFIGLFCYLTFVPAPQNMTSHEHTLWGSSFVITLLIGIPFIVFTFRKA